MTAIAQRSFAGGELAPALYARTDQVKYATGARRLRNMIVQRHGGVTNRSGTAFTQESKNSAVRCRLIEFILDATDIADTYLLEFGSGYIRFYQDGAPLVVSGVGAWANATAYAVGDLVVQDGVNYYCQLAHTSATATDKPGIAAGWVTKWWALTDDIYEIPTPYTTADLDGLGYVQSGDVITLVHGDYAPRDLSRRAHTNWALASIVFGPSIAAPTNVAAAGGAAGTIRYWAVTAIKEGSLEESLAGLYSSINKVPSAANPVNVTWDAVPGAISYNVYRSTDGQTYGLISSSGGNPIDSSDTGWTDTDETANSAVADDWAAAAGQCRNPIGAISATMRAYDAKYTITFNVTLTGGGDGLGLVKGDPTQTFGRVAAYYSRDGEARVLAGYSNIYVVEGVQVYTTTDEMTIDVPDTGYATLQIDLVPEVRPTVDGQMCSMNVNTAAGSVAWKGGASVFADVGASPDYSIGPAAHPTLFDAAGRYPRAVMYYQQRRVFASSTSEPEKAWASRIGSYANFAISTPLQADDAITFSLAGRQVNAIKHLLEVAERLIVFGSGRELVLQGDDAGTLRPDAINPGKLSTNGSGGLAPIEIDDSAIYLQGRGSLVRDLKPIGADGYQGTDLTIFAAHLFEGYTIVDWAYQQNPHSVIWAVRSDGKLLGLTYLRDQAIWGWHWHETDGVVENVRVIPEGDEDAVYLVVRRTINGATKRYIERMTSRFFTDIVDAVFMDAALSYNGWHTGVVTMDLSGGVAWTSEEQLVLTASAPTFAAANVGAVVILEDADGAQVRLTIEAYISTTIVHVRADRTVAASLQTAIGNGTGQWALAVDTLTGLAHLEGKAVSVLGDGYVLASPNNEDYDEIVVAGGQITLAEPHAIVHVGLPYTSDLETLDLDHPGPATVKDGKHNVSQVGLYIEKSRGIWAGQADQASDDDPLLALQELKARASEDYDDPTDLLTDFVQITIESNWNSNGRILVRQVDPLPMTILSATPIGHLAQ